MSKRWVRWCGGGLLAFLLAWAGWRLSIEVPKRLRGAEAELAAVAAQYGLELSHGGLKLHLLHFFLSLDDLEVRDAVAGRFLARAGHLEVSLSPWRLLKGEIPVSRIRIRNFRLEAGEWNRGVYERIVSAKGGGGGGLPEILFVDGSVRIGPVGPIRRFQADVQELRVREGRYLGTRIQASVARASGEISVPGEGFASWPYPSMEAELVLKGDVLKVRRARAWGDASTVRLSGFLETGKRLVEGKASGKIDLAKWISGGHPGASYARTAFRRGKIEFSASASGSWDNPEGRARVFLREGNFHGTEVPDAEAVMSSGSRVLRLDRAHATFPGGTVDAAGSYGLDGSRAELKAEFRRFPLSAVPWSELGIPYRLAGVADLDISVAGTTDRLRGTASLSLPEGVEQPAEPGRGGFKVRVPLTASVAAGLSDGKVLTLESVRLQAGQAEVRAEGEILPAGRSLRLRGTAQVPAGRAADYGFRYPLSWKGVAGEWAVSGPLDRPGATASLEIRGLAAGSLPPLTVTAKADGVPAEEIRFEVDVPSDSFKATAAGTVTSPMDPGRVRTSVDFSVREIDLADSGAWVSAVLASLGKDPGEIRKYLDGTSGMAEASGKFGLAPGTADFQGRARSSGMVVRGIPLKSIEAEGEYGKTDAGARWTARGGGRFGDGVIGVAAKGAPGGNAEASADIAGLRISQALALLKREGSWNVEGVVDARVEAREGPGGWELPRVTAASKELSVGAARIADVRAEGNLGLAAGRFTIGSASPRMSLSGEVQRGGGWPAGVTLSARALPTSFLLAAAGRPDVSSEGTWSAEGGGVIRLANLVGGKPITPEAFPDLHGTVRAEGPAAGQVRFRDLRTAWGIQGEILAGELVTSGPETRLAWEVSLREPFGFRLEGPFSLGESLNGMPRDDKRHLSVRGSARIAGALRAADRTTGSIRVDALTYREGGLELSGKDLTATMDAEGVRWKEGTLTAAGAPVRVSGKASWKGDLDARVDGKLPLGLVRLAVPGVFDRLDGVATLEVRVTGTLADPIILGTGRLEGGTLSFLGYAQQFEGLKADAVLSRNKIVFERFEGRSGGGYIDGWGEVPLRVDSGQRVYFSVDFFDMRYPYPQDLRPVVQGHVEVVGPVKDLLVTGEVEVQSARYTKNLYPEKALLDFRRRLSDVSARREKSDFRLRLDIDVVADRTIRVKNNLADMEASGEFKVQGDVANVILLGSFDVYEGYVEFYGNRYELKQVTIDFQDPRRNNPRLDARAETRKGNYNIVVLVSGTLDKPEVDFTSDPPLSRTDIVSLLSFGVTTQALRTPGAGPSSDIGAAGGAGIAIGSIAGMDEKIGGVVGLDQFTIETGFSQTTQSFEPRLVARKSFEDRLSVSFTQSVGTSSETSASGEIRLHENLYLEGGWQSPSTSTSGQISADLKVRCRFQSLKGLLNGRD